MPDRLPSKVLITGGREVGGLVAFAEGLAEGFSALGIATEVIPPRKVFGKLRELRDPSVLKILSTTAVFAAPMARRAICVAHGIARADVHGWTKMIAIHASFKLANCSRGTRLVAVSDYVAVHLRGLFNVRVDGVIRNPLQSLFLEPYQETERRYLTFAGRLVPIKNVHRLLPAMCELQKKNPELRICVIGDGPMREGLQASFPGVEFKGRLTSSEMRTYLRQTKVFVSGTEMEALGISYLEALSQGCTVAMPACGGGLEIALNQVGKRVHLLPLSWDQAQVTCVLRRALFSCVPPVSLTLYSSEAVAKAYLSVDSSFVENQGAVH
ncbi:MAG: glycosyltransferase family 4 protein [Candidatus Acidiferrales bacterium]